MTLNDASRRDIFRLAAIGATVSGVALSAGSAMAYQGNMEHALAALQEALGALQRATPNKGGHREHAMDLIRRAMWQVQAGIDFAASHGGG